MLVALEGVDGAGKTTLAEEVAKYAASLIDLDVELIHFGPPTTDDPLSEMVDHSAISEYAPGTGRVIVCDRLHFGGPVYAPIYRPELVVDEYGDLGKGAWRYAELFFESRGLLTVMVTSPRARLRAGLRGDDYIQVEDIAELQERYREVALESITLGQTIEAREPEQTRPQAVAITHAALAKERFFAPLAAHRGYIGTERPDVLIVMNPDRAARIDTLAALDVDAWKHVGIASSMESQQSLEELVDTLNGPFMLGYGRIPGHVENAIARRGGDYIPDLATLLDATRVLLS
jgi:hypothetical protein